MPILCKRDSQTGRFKRVAGCDQCQILVIQGVVCHEHGCPDAWKDEARECRWCGSGFKPEERGQQFCEASCQESHNT